MLVLSFIDLDGKMGRCRSAVQKRGSRRDRVTFDGLSSFVLVPFVLMHLDRRGRSNGGARGCVVR
jgi:hypothetical protein